MPNSVNCSISVPDFRECDAVLADALGLTTCLKPEVALMLELYEAGNKGKSVTVSVLGLPGGIAPTTTLRYLEALQKKGAVRRVAHETDNRMTYVELTESARAAMDAALRV
ncbi:MAG: hypothetical protein ABJK59_04130 [Erythrobacter sp.]|uniref:hypothetical protein n=1 Tax=Erythrobacter sp. TaxID=1042 RepID=UPI003298FE63